MPARKLQGLKVRHDTKDEKAERVAQEESMAPEHELPMKEPSRLKDHPIAAEVWRRLMRGWSEIEAKIVTRLDMDLVCDYCLLMEQVSELDRMRKVVYKLWLELGEAHEKLKQRARAFNEKANGEKDPEAASTARAQAERLEEKAIETASKVVDAFEAVVKLDGRADRKRALLLQWRQSLYLTPRSRAGAAPTKKEQEEPPDPFEQLLGDVTNYVNRPGDEK